MLIGSIVEQVSGEVYPEQIAAWRASCVAANANAAEQAREQRQQTREDKQRIKPLEKRSHRKEKTLARTGLVALCSIGP